MARSDYAHWNEDQDYMWWMEEGRHATEPPGSCDLCGYIHSVEQACRYEDDPEFWCDACGSTEHDEEDCPDDPANS